MGSIQRITLPAGYALSLYGVSMGSIHCITLTAMRSIHVPLYSGCVINNHEYLIR